MEITFEQGKIVTAHLNGHVIKTDQLEKDGGANSAPQPFELFLASMGTCAGIYVKYFCDKRDIPTDNIKILQHITTDEKTRLPSLIEFEIVVPEDFPKKYHRALINSAEMCKVKKTIENSPEFKTSLSLSK
ncbi:MAG: osmotically inducible protein OsmC [Bacteroidales bacterium]|nr:osmotically inducible protein OsmC [Bacteroidales bacterium]